jgi:hypothetical protein
MDQALAADQVGEPAYLVAGVKSDELEDMSYVKAFHDWLDAPIGREAANDQALMNYLTGGLT